MEPIRIPIVPITIVSNGGTAVSRTIIKNSNANATIGIDSISIRIKKTIITDNSAGSSSKAMASRSYDFFIWKFLKMLSDNSGVHLKILTLCLRGFYGD